VEALFAVLIAIFMTFSLFSGVFLRYSGGIRSRMMPAGGLHITLFCLLFK